MTLASLLVLDSLFVNHKALLNNRENFLEHIFLIARRNCIHVALVLTDALDLLIKELVDPLKVLLYFLIIFLAPRNQGKPIGLNSSIDLFFLFFKFGHFGVIDFLEQGLTRLL